MYQFNSNAPIYLQLIEIIKQQIINGTLTENAKVKSVRDYAVEFGVNPNTVQKALSELEKQGYIHTARTSGRFVALGKQDMLSAKLSIAENKTQEYIKAMGDIACSSEEILDLIKRELKKEGKQK